MRRMRVLGSAVGLLAVASGCTTTAGVTAESRFVPSQQVTRLSRAQQVAWRDSVYAQAVADAEGPGANIRAELSNFAGSRRLRAVFDLESDAYVFIGHIDADGVVRVVFPTDPVTDDGFVTGRRTYRTQEFFGGFNDQYALRAQRQFGSIWSASRTLRPDTYDGGFGYLFIVASWRPMRLDQFRSEGEWDSFELASAEYQTDPRPAIYELASLLVGESREAYTVKFARYMNTRNNFGEFAYGGGLSAFSSSAMCSGFGLMGFPFNPFDGFGMAFAGFNGYGSFSNFSFMRRGSLYYYDSFNGCYRQGIPRATGFSGYRIAGYQPPNLPKRPLDPETHRTPFTPRLVAEHAMPGSRGVTENPAAREAPRVSPAYRERGLITQDDPTTMPARRDPRGESRVGAEQRSRPTLQDMVSRRPATNTEQSRANGWRSQNGVGAGNGGSSRSGYTSPANRERERRVNDYQGESRTGMQSRERYAAPSDAGSRSGGSSAGVSSPPMRSAPPPSAAPPASSPPPSQAGPATSTAGRPGTP